MAPMAKQALIVLVTVIAFGILVPWYKGFVMLDARMIAAYGCLALLFVVPASSELATAGIGRIATVVAFGWGITLVTMITAMITVAVAYAHGAMPPAPYETITAVLTCSLTASMAIAACSAILARRFSARTAKSLLRFLFLLLLAAIAFSARLPDQWQIFLSEHTTRRAITRLAWEAAAVFGVLAVLLVVILARKPASIPAAD